MESSPRVPAAGPADTPWQLRSGVCLLVIASGLHGTTREPAIPVSSRLGLAFSQLAEECTFRGSLVCGQEYEPVCALTRAGRWTPYENACQACRDAFVLGYRLGRCQTADSEVAEPRPERPQEGDGAADGSEAAAVPAAAVPPPDCPYKKVFVDPQNAVLSGSFSAKSETFRRRYLELAPAALVREGFEVVPEISDAWLVLSADASLTAAGNLELGIGMRPTVRMFQHIFLIMMDDPSLSGDERRSSRK